MRLSGYRRIIAAVAGLCLLPPPLLAQGSRKYSGPATLPPKPSGRTPRTPDGHPGLDRSVEWLGDNLLGVPNQIANNGLAIESESSTHDLHSAC